MFNENIPPIRMSLKSLLPQPKNNNKKKNPLEQYNDIQNEEKSIIKPVEKKFPPYLERQSFIPRTDEDFGDGGAYPEIHLLQYPKGIGRKHEKTEKQLTLLVDEKGNLNYDEIVKQKQGNKVVYTKHSDTIEKKEKEELIIEEEEIQKSVEKTKSQLEELSESRINKIKPGNKGEDSYIRIQNQGETKIVKVIEMAQDPLEPPKFKLKKAAPRPPSPPVTILRSPPRKLTKGDMENWKIPAFISNWKNPKGYSIPLDKRLAADGRGLQEVQVNNGFANLSESLYAAEKISREDLEKRKELQKLVSLKEKEEREENLKRLAEMARKQREEEGENSSDEEKERIRSERRREIKEEKKKKKGKEDRDITEKIALGQPQKVSSEDQIDARLYNFDSGLTSGSFKTFDKPLFQGSGNSNIYKFKSEETKDFDMNKIKEDRFTKPSRELGGDEKSIEKSSRDGPVQFEREDDPFGMNKFLNEAKEGKKRGLEDIGKGGFMKLSSGGDYDSLKNSKRNKIDFEKEL